MKYPARTNTEEEVEILRRMLAWYMGEETPAPIHPFEKEYLELLSLPKDKWTKEGENRMVFLARALMKAQDDADTAFAKSMDTQGVMICR